VGPSEAKKGPGSGFFSFFFYRLFELPHRETPENVTKNREKIGFGFLVDFLFSFFAISFSNVFCSVFELPSLRNTRKRDFKKVEKKLTPKFLSIFWDFFSTWTFCKNISVVFLNSPCREASKNVQKSKSREKKSGDGWVGVGFSTCTGGIRRAFS
jgi:hypothetical protein